MVQLHSSNYRAPVFVQWTYFRHSWSRVPAISAFYTHSWDQSSWLFSNFLWLYWPDTEFQILTYPITAWFIPGHRSVSQRFRLVVPPLHPRNCHTAVIYKMIGSILCNSDSFTDCITPLTSCSHRRTLRYEFVRHAVISHATISHAELSHAFISDKTCSHKSCNHKPCRHKSCCCKA